MKGAWHPVEVGGGSNDESELNASTRLSGFLESRLSKATAIGSSMTSNNSGRSGRASKYFDRSVSTSGSSNKVRPTSKKYSVVPSEYRSLAMDGFSPISTSGAAKWMSLKPT